MIDRAVTTVLHPAAEHTIVKHPLAPRLSTLAGTTLALIDNRKRNANVYLKALGCLLQEEYGVARIVIYRKESMSIPTPDAILDDLACTCQGLVHAVAD
ncbi:MAG: hypothetical protein O7G88_07235 [bacterium]|nr:hypothetical protein [bacterium]